MAELPPGTQPTNTESNPAADPTPVRQDGLSVPQNIREKIERAIGSKIGDTQRGSIVERVTEIVESEIFVGPLPHPRHLEKYEEICPGAADRILALAEKSRERVEDRRDLKLAKEFEDRRLGMILAFCALALVIVCGTITSLCGHPIIGGGLLSAGIFGAVVTPFIHGRRPQPPSDRRPPG